MTTLPLESQTLVPQPTSPAGISWLSLTIGCLLFAAGVIVALIAFNVKAGEQVTFSTPSLLGFFFGIALSAASTVLAVAAISLGKASEQALIQRSDQSIRLQNEVFVRTTDALARIESSTGVTEKRIEDIISGRAGDLSHGIAQRLAEGARGQAPDPKQLEKEIRESILEQLSAAKREDPTVVRRLAAQKAQDAQTGYRRCQSDLLVAVANSDVAKCEKLGDGTFSDSGTDLVDVVVSVGPKRVALSTFSVRPPLDRSHLQQFPDFINKAAILVDKGEFHSLLLAFDGVLPADGSFGAVLRNIQEVMKPELAQRLIPVDGPENGAIPKVIAYLQSLADKPPVPKLA